MRSENDIAFTFTNIAIGDDYEEHIIVTVCVPICSHTLQALSIGYSICSPKDNFSDERGMEISKGRALKALRIRRPIVTRAGERLFYSHPLG